MKLSVLWKMIKKKKKTTRNARIMKEKRSDIYRGNIPQDNKTIYESPQNA